MNRPQPSSFHLHPSLSDWRLYAAAGAAAIAATSAADASIIYVDPSVKPDAQLPGAAPFGAVANVRETFAVDGVAASVEIQRVINRTANETFNIAYCNVGGRVIGTYSGHEAHHFQLGDPIAIGGGSSFQSSKAELGEALLQAGHFSRGSRGFSNSKSGFAGFQLPDSKGGGFGWIRFDVIDRDGDGYPDEVEAIDWAYNDAGGGITAGQGITAPVPEPGTKAMALLALGSAGVLAWRRGKRMKVEG